MAKCEFCDKGVTFGIQVSHSHRRSNRTWKPNVKRVKAIVNGSPPMFMFVPGVCVPVRSPERSNCTDKQVKHSDFGLSAFSIGMLRGSFHLHHSPASVCCFIPSDPIEMSSAGFPAKLVFDESYFPLRFLRNLRDLGISWKCGIK